MICYRQMRMLKSLINNSTIVVRVKYVIYKYSKFSLMVLVLSCFIALYFLLNIVKVKVYIWYIKNFE